MFARGRPHARPTPLAPSRHHSSGAEPRRSPNGTPLDGRMRRPWTGRRPSRRDPLGPARQRRHGRDRRPRRRRLRHHPAQLPQARPPVARRPMKPEKPYKTVVAKKPYGFFPARAPAARRMPGPTARRTWRRHARAAGSMSVGSAVTATGRHHPVHRGRPVPVHATAVDPRVCPGVPDRSHRLPPHLRFCHLGRNGERTRLEPSLLRFSRS